MPGVDQLAVWTAVTAPAGWVPPEPANLGFFSVVASRQERLTSILPLHLAKDGSYTLAVLRFTTRLSSDGSVEVLHEQTSTQRLDLRRLCVPDDLRRFLHDCVTWTTECGITRLALGAPRRMAVGVPVLEPRPVLDDDTPLAALLDVVPLVDEYQEASEASLNKFSVSSFLTNDLEKVVDFFVSGRYFAENGSFVDHSDVMTVSPNLSLDLNYESQIHRNQVLK